MIVIGLRDTPRSNGNTLVGHYLFFPVWLQFLPRRFTIAGKPVSPQPRSLAMSSTHDQNDFRPLFQTRRQMLQTVAGAAALTAAGPLLSPSLAAELKGRINHSVCLWCYDGFMKQAKMNLDEFAAACAKLGLKSIELTGPGQWPTLKKHGLICAMSGSHGITKGFNRVANHEECIAKVKKSIDDTAAAAESAGGKPWPNVICFSGNRDGLDDQEGLANCIAGLKKVAGYAEKKKVTICLEFLNSGTITRTTWPTRRSGASAWCTASARRG